PCPGDHACSAQRVTILGRRRQHMSRLTSIVLAQNAGTPHRLSMGTKTASRTEIDSSLRLGAASTLRAGLAASALPNRRAPALLMIQVLGIQPGLFARFGRLTGLGEALLGCGSTVSRQGGRAEEEYLPGVPPPWGPARRPACGRDDNAG